MPGVAWLPLTVTQLFREFWAELQHPLAYGYMRDDVVCEMGLLFCASCGRRHVRPLTCCASETGHRLSAAPEFSRGKARASQVTGPSSSCVLWSNTPPDTAPYWPDFTQRAVVAFDEFQHSRHPGRYRFRGRCPTARTFACLRFADGISTTVARLATGSGGLTLGRAGFAPAGRCTKFHGGIASSNSLRPTGLGRTKNSYSRALESTLGDCYSSTTTSTRFIVRRYRIAGRPLPHAP